MNTAMEGVCASSNKADARDYSLLYIYNPQQVAMLLAILCHVVAILSSCLFIQMLVLFAMPQQSSQNPSLQLLMSSLGEKCKSSTGPRSQSFLQIHHVRPVHHRKRKIQAVGAGLPKKNTLRFNIQ